MSVTSEVYSRVTGRGDIALSAHERMLREEPRNVWQRNPSPDHMSKSISDLIVSERFQGLAGGHGGDRHRAYPIEQTARDGMVAVLTSDLPRKQRGAEVYGTHADPDAARLPPVTIALLRFIPILHFNRRGIKTAVGFVDTERPLLIEELVVQEHSSGLVLVDLTVIGYDIMTYQPLHDLPPEDVARPTEEEVAAFAYPGAVTDQLRVHSAMDGGLPELLQ